MKSVVRLKYGSPKILKVVEIEKPKPNNNQILVKIFATTINRTDCGILRGKPILLRFLIGLFKPKSKIMGTDFAGQIVEIGKNVSKFKISDKVWGFNDEGLNSQSEYITIHQDEAISHIPNGLDYEQVVSCAEGSHYALNFLNKINLNKQSKILINGASGAIGTSLLQICNYYETNITAVCSTKSSELIKSLGADKIIDYEKDNFTNEKVKYDYIFDAVGKSSFSKCKHLLKSNGVYISSELGNNAENVYLSIFTKFFSQKKVIFPIPSHIKRTLKFMNELLEKNKFQPVIDRKYSIDEIIKAYEYVESEKKTGSVILMNPTETKTHKKYEFS